jgi:hypothetical protein
MESKKKHSFPQYKRFLGVGLVGCGAIGTVLARAIDEGGREMLS